MTMDTGPAPARPAPRLGPIAALALLALYVLAGIVVTLHSRGPLGPGGAPRYYDFSAFYEAGRMADAGQAADAYDDRAMVAAEQAAFPGVRTRLPWNYPPSFQLVMAPLAALPYDLAWIVWTVSTVALYALLARRLAPPRDLWVLLLAPAAAINLLVGQNGLLTTVLMGAGVLSLERRPLLGGALLGLLSYKPHFAVVAPVMLVATRQWRALAGAVLAGGGLALASLALLGPAPWIAFFGKALHPAVFTSSSSDWRNIPSVQVMARTLGLPAGLASGLHWSVAAAALAAAGWTWRRTGDPRLRAGALAAATLLVTPYLRLYDLVLLVLPTAALMTARPARAERVLLAAAWLAPAALMFANPPVQLGPLCALALLALVSRRALAPQAALGH